MDINTYVCLLGEPSFYNFWLRACKRLGGIVPDKVHTPHFQECILRQIPWMIGQKADKKLYIACEAMIGKAAACEINQSPD